MNDPCRRTYISEFIKPTLVLNDIPLTAPDKSKEKKLTLEYAFMMRLSLVYRSVRKRVLKSICDHLLSVVNILIIRFHILLDFFERIMVIY